MESLRFLHILARYLWENMPQSSWDDLDLSVRVVGEIARGVAWLREGRKKRAGYELTPKVKQKGRSGPRHGETEPEFRKDRSAKGTQKSRDRL